MQSKGADLPGECLRLARADLRTAEALLEADEATYVGFHLQQAVEKALKGVLLSAGRAPPRIHDLGELLDLASASMSALERYRDLCLKITGFYTAHRYPGLEPVWLPADELEPLRLDVEALVDVLQVSLG